MWGYLQTDGDRSIFHAKEIIRLTEKATSEGLLVRQDAFRILGQHAYAVCMYDSALHCYERSLQIIEQCDRNNLYPQTDIDDMYSVLYATIGNLYNIQGMTTLAMDFYLKALPLFEHNGWYESVSTLYYNVGEMYLEMGNNVEARKAYGKSLEAAMVSGDSLILVAPHYGLATVLLNEGHPQEALAEEREAMKYLADHPDEEPVGLMNAYVMMARIYGGGLGNNAEAQRYMNMALELSAGMDSIPELADVYTAQAELCLSRKEWHETMEWCLEALDVNDQDPHHNIGVYKMLSEAYARLGYSDESVHYLDLLHNTMETMSNHSHQTALSEMEVRYETQKKEARIAQITQRQHMLLLFVAVVIILFVVIIIGILRVNRHKRRTIAAESKLLGERDERSRLGRDLHDRVGGMLTATRLTLEQGKTDQAVQMLQDTSIELRKVAHNLMPDSLARHGLNVALSDYCSVLPNVEYECLGNPVRLPANIEVLVYSTVHELINNALRYADAEIIKVQLLYGEEELTALVADNGHGFNVKSESKGMGLANIRERIRSLGGTFEISSSSAGTEACLEIRK